MSEANDNTAFILQISADNSRMLRAFEASVAKIDKYTGEMESRAKKGAKKIEDAFASPNLGKSLQKVFDSSRLNILEEGGARLRIFGSALEPLGAFGLAAAAGVAAFAFAMERTEKAVEFAAGIAKLGKETGTTTDFIQEFNFAARQSEIDVGQADVALKKLNQSLGLVQAGLAKKQLANAFKAVGFTPEQLRQFHDVGDFFPVLVDRIAKIGDAAEQAAIAKRLGIEELLPLLQSGATNFNALAKSARDLGVVMDEATIRKAEEAKVKLNELDQVMKAKANITFVEFTDTLIKLKTAMLDVEVGFLRLVAAITNTDQDPKQRLKQLSGNIREALASGAQNSPAGRTLLAHYTEQVNEILAKLPKAPAGPPAARTTAKQLVDSTPKHGASDPTLNFDKSAQDAYDNGLKALISAQAALLLDVQARAEAEKLAVDAETTKKLHDLEAEELKIRAAKNDRHKAEQLSLIEKAKAEEQNAAAAKKEKIDRDAAEARRREALAYEEQQLDGQSRLLELEQSLTFNEQTRQRLAQQLVDLAYEKVRAELEGVIASKAASEADKKLAQLKLDQLNAQHPLDQEQARRSGSGPTQQVGQIVAGIKQRSNAADDARQMYAEIARLRQADVISEREAAQAKAAVNAQYNQARLQQSSEFFGNLATLSESSNKTLHAIGKAAAIAQATIDGILAVQRALASAPPPFNFALAAAAGVAAAVNVAKIAGLEQGGYTGNVGRQQVAGFVHGQEYVINAPATARNRPLLEAINAGRPIAGYLPAPQLPGASAAGGGPAGAGDFHFHYNDHSSVSVQDPDLGRLLERQPRALRKHLENMFRNGEIRMPRT